jgi:CheY-like chemotaxis protein
MGQALPCAAANRPPRILICDDCEASRGLLRRLLARSGYAIDEAVNGEAAIEVVEAAVPDLILLDLRLPDIDGAEVLRQLRLDYNATRLPIIMVSAEHDGEVVAGCLSLGANDYVTKPIQTMVLRSRVLTFLAVHSARADIESARRAKAALRERTAHGSN